MSDTPAVKKPRRLWTMVRVFGDFVSRIYGLVLMLVLGYTTYLAGAYLFGFVFKPVHTPKSILQSQARNDLAILRDPVAANPRADDIRPPLAHYHPIGRRITADPLNGCTVTGCHDPLPHGKHMKVPAFGNFHVGFLACQSCHTETKERPTKYVWMNVQTHLLQSPPAALRLTKLLDDSESLRKSPAASHGAILTLVGQLLQLRSGDHGLEDIRSQLSAAEPGSPVWRANVSRLALELSSHGPGGYGAALIPESQLRGYVRANKDMTALAAEYAAAPVDSAPRKALNNKIHANVAKRPGACAMCHSDSPGLVDFEAAGYLSARARTLSNLQLARIVDQVRGGGEFHLPTLVGAANEK